MRITLTLIVFFTLCTSAWCQDTPKEPKVIQFTGVVMAPDSNSVIPGVHVYAPLGGRGTTTNPYGFFSLPVLEGDSIVFSAIGFQKRSYIIPEHDEPNSLRLIVTLEEDVTLLNEVEIFPYPTEEMFKKAVLSLEMPYQREYNNMNAWLQSEYMNTAYAELSNSANANQRYYQQLQMQAIQNRYQTPKNNLLNPWAWAKAINDLKKK
ncbi:carboxypeptidase-like regulatory domain-containing protein [Marinoscillum furvescens]|uniref:Carboxypeptidase-like protein n=1 Tax=Marinoscillum furvescens DSM 4134 TaxID=1122208 RepID=A0A3D9KZB7_MARFU|nr:carboxypeptidase-like regulatory domain-containing protein [Marinoscillum furvescens]RED93623.1 carboxypeptidase-like protein [Marinoscillum furvescens DSM 4134]